MTINLKNFVFRQRSHLKRRFRAISHEWKYRRFKAVEVEIDGVRVTFNTSDVYSKNWWFPRYLDGRIHEPAVTHLVVRLARHAQWFADVGANIGWYTCLVASILPGGRVDAFEMNPVLCKILEENLHINHLDARIHNVAVTADSSEVSFSLEEAMGTYIPKASFRAAGRTRQVKGEPLDGICKDNQGSGLIKIDVEGAEMDVVSVYRPTAASPSHLTRPDTPMST
jgi:FkbM family methyltransferase